ncbi:hypothetical protein [Yersinia intermedia]|uniref:hypothetical protein n=1 Tax=Yersinia intermedia TaxID=631 RepID=UPI0005AD65F7|nr:hypothetical protein [Yersinia intermedia]AJJ18219.1 hypothetical protein CH53_2944 [Yersinia intermedia]
MDNIASHQDNKAKKLYRRVNTTTRYYSDKPGGEYRHASREIKKRDTANILPQRESMYVKQQLRLDYSLLLCMSEKRTLAFFIKIRFVLFCTSLETKNIASVIYPALF